MRWFSDNLISCFKNIIWFPANRMPSLRKMISKWRNMTFNFVNRRFYWSNQRFISQNIISGFRCYFTNWFDIIPFQGAIKCKAAKVCRQVREAFAPFAKDLSILALENILLPVAIRIWFQHLMESYLVNMACTDANHLLTHVVSLLTIVSTTFTKVRTELTKVRTILTLVR